MKTYNFLVTCGRGLENFVIEEIREKVIQVSNVSLLNEGKISFSISPSVQLPPDAGISLVKQQFCGIFQLKLVERIFLLLFFETRVEFQSNSSLEDGSVVDKVCSSVDWKEATAKIHNLLSLFPPAQNKGCICIPGGATEDLTANMDPILGSCGGKTRKRKKSRDHLVNAKQGFKMAQQPCPNKKVRSPATDTETFLNDSSAELPTSSSHLTCMEMHPAPDFDHFTDSPIRFRASCRVTGKMKKILSNRTFNVGFNLFNHKYSAPKTSCSRLLTDEDNEVNFPLPHLNSTNVETLKSKGLEDRAKHKKVEKYDDTGKDMNATNQLSVGKTAFKQPVVIDAISLKKNNIQTLTTSADDDTVTRPCEEHRGTLSPGSVIGDEPDRRMTNSRSGLLPGLVRAVLQGTQGWCLDWSWPHVDVYLNITDLHVLLGVALRRTPVSLRSYIPHIGLRSTLCCLLVHLALKTSLQLTLPDQNDARKRKVVQSKSVDLSIDDSMPHVGPEKRKFITLLDPMCGAGTLLAEAVHSFDVSHVIGCDVSAAQLQLATCNLRLCPPSSQVSLLRADAAALPLHSVSVDAVVCDFPFGQQHRAYLTRAGETRAASVLGAPCDESMRLLALVLEECTRVVVAGGAVVLLLPSSKEAPFLRMCSELAASHDGTRLQLKSSHRLALGTSSGLVCVLRKSLQDSKII